MTDFSNWINAGAATAAAVFSYLAWRGATRAAEPEAVLASAELVTVEGEETYAQVRLGVRNLTAQTLYVKAISFARTRAALEVSQAHERDSYGGEGKPKDFRRTNLEEVGWMIVRPAGTSRSVGSTGDTIWTNVRLRFPARVPALVVAEVVYSYGSPSGRKRRIQTNEQPLMPKRR